MVIEQLLASKACSLLLGFFDGKVTAPPGMLIVDQQFDVVYLSPFAILGFI